MPAPWTIPPSPTEASSISNCPEQVNSANAALLPTTAREVELTVVHWLTDLGLHAVDHPDTPTFQQTGQGILPDVGLRLGTGGPTFMLKDGPIDVLGEVKIQRRTGTAIDKMPDTIDRYARVFDTHGIPTVIFYEFDAVAANALHIERLQMLADVNLVGFVEIGSVTAPQLRALVADLMRRRVERIGTDAGLRELYASLAPEQVAALYRMVTSLQAPVQVAGISELLW